MKIKGSWEEQKKVSPIPIIEPIVSVFAAESRPAVLAPKNETYRFTNYRSRPTMLFPKQESPSRRIEAIEQIEIRRRSQVNFEALSSFRRSNRNIENAENQSARSIRSISAIQDEGVLTASRVLRRPLTGEIATESRRSSLREEDPQSNSPLPRKSVEIPEESSGAETDRSAFGVTAQAYETQPSEYHTMGTEGQAIEPHKVGRRMMNAAENETKDPAPTQSNSRATSAERIETKQHKLALSINSMEKNLYEAKEDTQSLAEANERGSRYLQDLEAQLAQKLAQLEETEVSLNRFLRSNCPNRFCIVPSLILEKLKREKAKIMCEVNVLSLRIDNLVVSDRIHRHRTVVTRTEKWNIKVTGHWR